MINAQLDSFLKYAAYSFVGAFVATGLQLAAMLAGDGDILWRPLAASFLSAFFGALATAWGTSRLPRAGSEALAADVDALRAAGVSRRDMQVIRRYTQGDEVDVYSMTPDERQVLAMRLKREMQERP